jgi:hypothetical protein
VTALDLSGTQNHCTSAQRAVPQAGAGLRILDACVVRPLALGTIFFPDPSTRPLTRGLIDG